MSPNRRRTVVRDQRLTAPRRCPVDPSAPDFNERSAALDETASYVVY